MTVRIPVAPEILTWALERAGLSEHTAHARFPKIQEWIDGESLPTYKQIEHFAQSTHVPLGYLFLEEPPVEPVPLPDFRTRGNTRLSSFSAELRETIYDCEIKQEWYRTYAIRSGAEPLRFVGSVSHAADPRTVAAQIRLAIGLTPEKRRSFSNSEEMLRGLIDMIEATGVLVPISSVVKGNNNRPLDPDEFGGFAMSDTFAPLIFVNAADTRAAQIFTIIHELAHIWAGESALSDPLRAQRSTNRNELWCNQVAGEVLVPEAELRDAFQGDHSREALERIARIFRVSTLVLIKRLHETGALEWEEYREIYADEESRVIEFAVRAREKRSSGGSFYLTQPIRLSRRFATAVARDTLQGGTLYGDAYRLLGTTKAATFDELATRLGVG
ncbi:Zn-dependent peptidase ImmA (M78 family) [Mycetocola sp. BIGb0189]|uniref:ImmA/IrrE family metallo-endopeptidase n=1 Tax=Mycetocola sp. BIGb0189 TaxID=2940604 RepID=UPI00216A8AAC|nr:ImmA/IrrE family metallo-endopeptidase [Mycetocola sp. BIGb0189]MCS4276547.1 Zn-dependent peptidase ImmA (M78 family) [Mycetocola sp. BIGb0189]